MYGSFLPLPQVSEYAADLGTSWVKVADAGDELNYVAVAGSSDLEVGVSDDAGTNPTEPSAYFVRASGPDIWQIEPQKYVWVRATGGNNQTFLFRGWTTILSALH